MDLAKGYAALRTAAGLFLCFLGCILLKNLVEVAGTRKRRALFRHLPGNADEAK